MLTSLKTKLSGNSLESILARGASGSFLVDGFGQALVLGVQILMARLMGVENYGIYAYVMAWVTVLFLVSRLGLETLLLRHIAAFRSQQAWGLMRGVWLFCNRWSLGASVAVGIATLIVVSFLRDQLGEATYSAFWWGALLLPFIVVAGLVQSGLNGLKHVVLAQLPNRALRQIFLALLLGLVWYLGYEITGALALGLTIAAVALSFLIGLWWLLQRLPAEVKSATPEYRRREWLLTALPLMLAAGAFMFTQKTDTLMIGAILGTDEAGFYSVASRVAEFTNFGMVAATTIAAPFMSEFFSQQKESDLQRVVTLTAWGAVAFSLPFALVVFFFGQQLLQLFRPEFVVGYSALLILVFGQVANSFTGPIGVLMNMTGHQNHLVVILSVALVINAVLNYFLIHSMGIAGAALATAIVKIGWNLAAVVYAYRKFGINCFALSSLPFRGSR